jgi:dienelactone hydrolase
MSNKGTGGAEVWEKAVRVIAGPVGLEADLVVPPGAAGLVMFVHGSGSSRHSPRNRAVAGKLQAVGLATLLLDLLTSEEDVVDAITREFRFDIEMLAERVVAATGWVATQPELGALRLGYFGASTGAAAALKAAAVCTDRVAAVVSRGGRPDLAMAALPRVHAPTLLIVGGYDDVVIELNRKALAQLGGEKELAIVPAASHLFEEPGKLGEVARLAAGWFSRHLLGEAGPDER